jgi:hypothetical protein
MLKDLDLFQISVNPHDRIQAAHQLLYVTKRRYAYLQHHAYNLGSVPGLSVLPGRGVVIAAVSLAAPSL